MLNGDNKGQDMKEELKRFLTEREDDYWYGCDSVKMCELVDEFFNHYQPERSKREDDDCGDPVMKYIAPLCDTIIELREI